MKYIMGQDVVVTHVENEKEIDSHGKIVWDYNNDVYDVEIKDGKVVSQHKANIYPVAGFIQTPSTVEDLSKKAIEEELQSIEARRAYLIAIKDEQPENDVPDKVEVEAGELTEDHSETIFTPALENEEKQQEFTSEKITLTGGEIKVIPKEERATELIRQALELLEGK